MAETRKAAIAGLRNHAGTLAADKGHGLIKVFKAQPDVEVVAYCEVKIRIQKVPAAWIILILK